MRTCGRRLLTRDAAAHCIQIQAAFFRDFDCRANTFASKRWHHNPALLDVQNDCAFRWGIRRACTCTGAWAKTRPRLKAVRHRASYADTRAPAALSAETPGHRPDRRDAHLPESPELRRS